MNLRLTRRQHSLLWMDVVDVGTTPDTEPIARELQQGMTVTVTPQLIDELRNGADKDADPDEQRIYRNLLVRARFLIDKREI